MWNIQKKEKEAAYLCPKPLITFAVLELLHCFFDIPARATSFSLFYHRRTCPQIYSQNYEVHGRKN
jgi:hypothetical protein